MSPSSSLSCGPEKWKRVHTDTARMLTAALFTAAAPVPTRAGVDQQSACVVQWTVIQPDRNVEQHRQAASWVNLEHTLRSERSQSQRDHILSGPFCMKSWEQGNLYRQKTDERWPGAGGNGEWLGTEFLSVEIKCPKVDCGDGRTPLWTYENLLSSVL